MAIVCMLVTLICALPSCYDLLCNPRKKILLLSLINVSLAFFLCSFQVHEKSILLVALPVVLYFPMDPLPCLMFLQTATFSMLPLLKQDNLLIAYVGLQLFFMFSIRLMVNTLLTPVKDNPDYWFDVFHLGKLFVYQKDGRSSDVNILELLQYRPYLFGIRKLEPSAELTKLIDEIKVDGKNDRRKKTINKNEPIPYRKLLLILYYLLTIVQISFFLAFVFYRPPDNLPHLMQLLISIKSAFCFLLFCFYFNVKQIFD